MGAPNPMAQGVRIPVDTTPTGSPIGGGGGGGYGSGGGGSSGPSDEQKKAAANLGSITGYNADALRDKYDDASEMYDIADRGNQNLRDANILQARQQAGSDWFRQHKKLQATASALNDRGGNAMRGSYLYDYRDLLAAADDNIDSETLDTQRENINSVLSSYQESLMQNINSRNEDALSTEYGLRELYADYAAQLNNIHPDLAAQYMNNGGNTLNAAPDWLMSGGNFFDQRKQEIPGMKLQSLYRPDQANHDARQQGLKGGNYNTASSAIGSYWDRMNRGYDQRERQA